MDQFYKFMYLRSCLSKYCKLCIVFDREILMLSAAAITVHSAMKEMVAVLKGKTSTSLSNCASSKDVVSTCDNVTLSSIDIALLADIVKDLQSLIQTFKTAVENAQVTLVPIHYR